MAGSYSRYGWLREAGGGGGGGITLYNPNPGGQPNVAAYWDFSESSGNFVDSVNSIALVPTGVSVSTKQRRLADEDMTAADLLYSNLLPGMHQYDGVNNYLYAASASALDNGTGDYTIEFWFRMGREASTQYFFQLADSSAFASGISLAYLAATNKIQIWHKATDASSFLVQSSSPTFQMNDNRLLKVRHVINKTTEQALTYVNGELVNTRAITGWSTKQYGIVECYNSYVNGANEQKTNYALRISHNATNNAGGPGGG